MGDYQKVITKEKREVRGQADNFLLSRLTFFLSYRQWRGRSRTAPSA